ncbi:MAG: flagellar FliJ family protein [Planctomycetota bacterium]
MPIENEIARLTKILEFYRKELDVKKSILATKVTHCTNAEIKLNQLSEVLELAGRDLGQASPSLSRLQVGQAYLSRLSQQKSTARTVQKQRREELREYRLEVMQQRQKIESLEKLIESKQAACNAARQKREWAESDDRFLAQNFRGESS